MHALRLDLLGDGEGRRGGGVNLCDARMQRTSHLKNSDACKELVI